MTTPTSDELVAKLLESVERIGRMCSEGRPPKMRIPATPDDDDIFICTTIREAIASIAPVQGAHVATIPGKSAAQSIADQPCSVAAPDAQAGEPVEPPHSVMPDTDGLWVCESFKEYADALRSRLDAVERDLEVKMMTNDELVKAIEAAWQFTQKTATCQDTYRPAKLHYEILLGEQARRAANIQRGGEVG